MHQHCFIIKIRMVSTYNKNTGAQHAAKYLSETQWGTNNQNEPTQIDETVIIPPENQGYTIPPPTIEETRHAIRKLKRRKAPGPDEVPTELLKELSIENLEELQELST
jgi:hypothetical protein